MKKLFLYVVAVFTLVAFAGCGAKEQPTIAPAEEPTVATSPSEEPTAEPTPAYSTKFIYGGIEYDLLKDALEWNTFIFGMDGFTQFEIFGLTEKDNGAVVGLDELAAKMVEKMGQPDEYKEYDETGGEEFDYDDYYDFDYDYFE